MLMQEEAATTADKKQHLILTNLLRLRQQIVDGPRCGGLKVGKVNNKDRHRLVCAMLLDSNYFADNARHIAKDFGWRFRMNKELFMRIVFDIMEYDNYFMCKKYCTGLWGFSLV
jgi:hypothetical protein